MNLLILASALSYLLSATENMSLDAWLINWSIKSSIMGVFDYFRRISIVIYYHFIIKHILPKCTITAIHIYISSM